MKIRFAEQKDMDVIMALGVQMHQESRFKSYPLKMAKLQISAEKLIANPKMSCVLLAERAPGDIVGFLAVYMIEYFFTDAFFAQDMSFYVRPADRGSSAALKLLLAFKRWAENRQAVELCINMSVDIEQKRFEKFMTHMNFKSCGSNFVLPLKNSAVIHS